MIRVIKIFCAFILAVVTYILAVFTLSSFFVLAATCWLLDKEEGQKLLVNCVDGFKELHNEVKNFFMS